MTSMMGFISLCSRVAAGAHSHSEASILQLEFVRLRLVENSEDDPGLRISARECVEIICENLRNLWLIPIPIRARSSTGYTVGFRIQSLWVLLPPGLSYCAIQR